MAALALGWNGSFAGWPINTTSGMFASIHATLDDVRLEMNAAQ
jgi:hypothetical protein